jgi:Bifunctional DNA primase/polymerase, N-terminal/Primase C terminal 1 (PriCT-1)
MTTANFKNHSNHAVYMNASNTPSGYSPIQEMALYLYGLGFNVFPQPHGKKYGLPWKQLQYTRLDPTHSLYGIAALTVGKCNLAIMCGHTSDNLFVIDCETQTALDHHLNQLRQRHIPLWVVSTARGGHIYLRCADGEVANIESGRLQDAEVRGCNGYVLAPGSVHPTGALYQWIQRDSDTPPTVHIHDINWLTNRHNDPVRLKLTKSKARKFNPYTPLSRATQDYLTYGHSIPEGSRNTRLFSAACDMLGCGYTIDEIEPQLATLAQHSGLPQNEVHNTLRSAAAHIRQPARPQRIPTSKDTPPNVWKNALHFAHNHQWTGRTATTDKLVFLALVERAKTANNDTQIFRGSHREISILARCTLRTTRKALKRLLALQYINKKGSDRVSEASLWQFNESAFELELKSDPFPATPPWKRYSESLSNSSDVIERGALGYNGLYLYQSLVAEGQPLMPNAIVSLSGLSIHQVNYGLKKLCNFGLVQREKTGWRAIALSDAELEIRVALPTGKLGRGEARRRKYAEERALYVGTLISNARLALFYEDFLDQARTNLLYQDSAPPSGEANLLTRRAAVSIWRCPNCGQQHFADVPPEMCDFCQDLTTWQPLVDGRLVVDSVLAALLADPVVREGLALGGMIRYINDVGEQLTYPLLE